MKHTHKVHPRIAITRADHSLRSFNSIMQYARITCNTCYRCETTAAMLCALCSLSPTWKKKRKKKKSWFKVNERNSCQFKYELNQMHRKEQNEKKRTMPPIHSNEILVFASYFYLNSDWLVFFLFFAYQLYVNVFQLSSALQKNFSF